MSVRKRWPLVLALAFVLAAARVAAALDAIAPDAKVQRAIAEVPGAKTGAELDAALAKLKAATGGDYDTLVPQLVYFSMRGTDVRDAMTAGVVIDRLQVSKDVLLRAIVPYLDTTDAGLQRQLRNVLSAVDAAPDGQPPDFARYGALLRQRRDALPVVLVTHMVETAPDLALETLAATVMVDDTARRTLRARKPGNAADLEGLAQHDAWWVRLYVVERLRLEPALRAPALMQRLRDDVHPAVRTAARGLSLQ